MTKRPPPDPVNTNVFAVLKELRAMLEESSYSSVGLAGVRIRGQRVGRTLEATFFWSPPSVEVACALMPGSAPLAFSEDRPRTSTPWPSGDARPPAHADEAASKLWGRMSRPTQFTIADLLRDAGSSLRVHRLELLLRVPSDLRRISAQDVAAYFDAVCDLAPTFEIIRHLDPRNG